MTNNKIEKKKKWLNGVRSNTNKSVKYGDGWSLNNCVTVIQIIVKKILLFLIIDKITIIVENTLVKDM